MWTFQIHAQPLLFFQPKIHQKKDIVFTIVKDIKLAAKLVRIPVAHKLMLKRTPNLYVCFFQLFLRSS